MRFGRPEYWLLGVSALAFACASSDDGNPTAGIPNAGGASGGSGATEGGASGGNLTTTGGTQSGTGGSATGGAGASDGGTTTNGGADGIATGGTWPEMAGGFSYDPSKNAEQEECVATAVEAEEIFLDIFLILDRSNSMGTDCNVGDTTASQWCNAINAIHSFFSDPSSVGQGLAYGDFAFSECDGFDLALGFDVITAGDANGHLAALRSRLDGAAPGSGTNTEGAVRTLINQTSAHQPSGSRRTVGVLVTDGEPYLTPVDHTIAWQLQACASEADTDVDTHLSELNALLTDHFTTTGIPTFVIGMNGVGADQLDILATGTGATERSENCADDDSDATCSYYAVADGSGTAFQQAFEAIRRSVVGCEYALDPADVGAADIADLEVTFQVSSSTTAQPLTQVGDAASCTGGDEYFVDESSESPIVILCQNVCDARTEETTIGIQLTCAGQ